MLDLPTGGDLDARMRDLVHRGLRVKLESASFLTGQKQLAMDIYPDAGPGELGKQGDAYVIPVLGGGSDDIATAATNLVNRLNDIPFEIDRPEPRPDPGRGERAGERQAAWRNRSPPCDRPSPARRRW